MHGGVIAPNLLKAIGMVEIKPEPEERLKINTEEAKKYLDPAYINAYSLQHAKGIYEGQRRTNSGKRVVNLTRSSYAGQHGTPLLPVRRCGRQLANLETANSSRSEFFVLPVRLTGRRILVPFLRGKKIFGFGTETITRAVRILATASYMCAGFSTGVFCPCSVHTALIRRARYGNLAKQVL